MLVVNNLPAVAGDRRDPGSFSGLRRSPGEGNGYPLQYFCLENPMNRGPRWATVHRVTKSWTRRKRLGTLYMCWMSKYWSFAFVPIWRICRCLSTKVLALCKPTVQKSPSVKMYFFLSLLDTRKLTLLQDMWKLHQHSPRIFLWVVMLQGWKFINQFDNFGGIFTKHQARFQVFLPHYLAHCFAVIFLAGSGIVSPTSCLWKFRSRCVFPLRYFENVFKWQLRMTIKLLGNLHIKNRVYTPIPEECSSCVGVE